MKVFVYSARSYDQPVLQKASLNKHELLFTPERLNSETANYAKDCQAVSIFTADDASAIVLEKLYACGIRYVALRSVGHDHVDIAKANALGIQVANVPEYSPYAVAEHAVTMLMALNRKIVEGQMLMQLHDFRLDTLTGFDVHGKTVGIIGTGKIGIAFARIMLGFGAKILANDLQPNEEGVRLGIKYVSLEELLKRSDIISFHCPLTTHTTHLLAKAQFALMKKECILINTSRGAVINTTDLINALENERIGGACLDVYEFEKDLFFEDHRNDVIHDVQFASLRNFKNVLMTPHQAFLTSNALQGIAETTMLNLDHWEKGEPSPNEINMELHQLTDQEKN